MVLPRSFGIPYKFRFDMEAAHFDGIHPVGLDKSVVIMFYWIQHCHRFRSVETFSSMDAHNLKNRQNALKMYCNVIIIVTFEYFVFYLLFLKLRCFASVTEISWLKLYSVWFTACCVHVFLLAHVVYLFILTLLLSLHLRFLCFLLTLW